MERSTHIFNMQKKYKKLNVIVNWGYSIILVLFILGVVCVVYWYDEETTTTILTKTVTLKVGQTGKRYDCLFM